MKKVLPLGGGIELCGCYSCVQGLRSWLNTEGIMRSLLNTEGIMTLLMFLLSDGFLI